MPSQPFHLWSSVPDVFVNAEGQAVSGLIWSNSDSADDQFPIWVADSTPQSSLSATGDDTYTIELTTEDLVGAVQPELEVTAETLVDPFGRAGNLAAPVMFSSSGDTGSGGVVYWTKSTTAGDYALAFQSFTTTYPSAPSGSNSTTLDPSPVTLIAAISQPTSWRVANTSSDLVLAYAAAGAAAGTENIWIEAFNAAGQPATTLLEAETALSAGTPYFVGYNSAEGFHLDYVKTTDGNSVWYSAAYNPQTGELSSPVAALTLNGYSKVYHVSTHVLSDGDILRFVEGVKDKKAVLQVFQESSGGAKTSVADTIHLPGAKDQWSICHVEDPVNGENDYTALAYTYGGHVYLDLINASGKVIGSPQEIAGLTSFDRLQELGSGAGPRVEIDYTYKDGNGEQQIGAEIFDTQTQGVKVTLTTSGEYTGSTFNDTFTDTGAAGAYFVDGGGGVDTLVVNAAGSAVDLTTSAGGDIVVNDGASNAVTLNGFSSINLTDEKISLGGTASARSITTASDGLLQLGAPFPTDYSLDLGANSEVVVQTGSDLGAQVGSLLSGDKFLFDDVTSAGDTLLFKPGAANQGGGLELVSAGNVVVGTLFAVAAGAFKTSEFTLSQPTSGESLITFS